MNRIGDFGFLLGILAVWATLGDIGFDALKRKIEGGALDTAPWLGVFLMAMGLFSGAVGKSAQLPLQTWLPAINQSLFGVQPKAYWDLARSSGIAAYLLMWLSVAFGLIITNRMARIWPGGPTAFDLHQFSSLLGMGFAVFHGLILLGDQYINFTLPQILIPFASVNYKTIWVGLGQLAFYALIPVTFTSIWPAGATRCGLPR